MRLSRRRLLALGAVGALTSACQQTPKVMLSERPVQGQVAPEVHDQQPVVAVHTEEAEYERFWTEHRAIHAARTLRLTQDGVLAAQAEQVAV